MKKIKENITINTFFSSSNYLYITLFYTFLFFISIYSVSHRELIIPLIFTVLFFQTFSVQNAIFIFIFFIFFHDISKNLYLGGTEALQIGRLTIIPVFFLLQNKRIVRKVNNKNFKYWGLIVFSSISVLLIVMMVNLLKNQEYSSFIDFAGIIFDYLILLFFSYLIFSRLKVEELKLLFFFIVFLSFLHSLQLINIAINNPEMLYIKTENFAKNYVTMLGLWSNPLFGHKNYWGTVAAYFFVIGVLLFFFTNSNKLKILVLTIIVSNLATLVISLSRRAYFYALLGLFFVLFIRKSLKFIYVIAGIAILIILSRPDFFLDRIIPLLHVQSFYDLQKISSGHVSNEAINLFEKSLSIIPYVLKTHRIFYNYSEAYIVSILYYQGIFGALFLILVIMLVFNRAREIFRKINNDVFSNVFFVSAFLLVPTILSTTAYYFITSSGLVNAFSFILLYLYMLNETLYREKNKSNLFWKK